MNKSIIILKREYLTRVKNKSFLILTFLVPMLFVGMGTFSAWVSTASTSEQKTIAVFDEPGLSQNRLQGSKAFQLSYIEQDKFNQVKAEITDQEAYDALLYIPNDVLSTNTIELISRQQIASSISSSLKAQLQNLIETDKRDAIYKEFNVPNLEARLRSTKTSLDFKNLLVDDKGNSKETATEFNNVIGMIVGFIIYTMIILYGSMVMRAVMEEKTSRISEVLVSSVRPIELMFGKIIGVGLVGVTQFLLWVLFFVLLIAGGLGLYSSSHQLNLDFILEPMQSLNIPFLLTAFFIFFVLGYLLYSSIMGAIGSSVSNLDEGQSATSIVMIPLIGTFMLISPISQDPNGTLAFWASMFPLSSPIAMLTRLPSGVPLWQILCSIVILIATTIACIWVASKIYRTGILMYGKNATLKEMWKWVKYK